MRSWFSNTVLAALVLLGFAAPVAAGITLDPPFADGMVIQRGQPVPVRGTAPGASAVVVGFAGQKKTAPVDGEGRFEIVLSPLGAGPARVLGVRSSNDEVLQVLDVLVGDVWLCSGQSNMGFTVRRSKDAAKEIAAADHPSIRLMTVPRRPRQVPTRDLPVRWLPCSPKSVPSFSAVGYYFGRELSRKVRVPIGLVNSSYGGTPAEAWTRAEALSDDALRGRHEKARAAAKAHPRSPSTLWNGMIAPLAGFPIRGVIWYQGESNATRAEQYRTLFPAMISDWREQWGREDLPFLFVQLANWGKDPPNARGSNWAELREAQLFTVRSVPGTGMAVTIDIGDPADIHPANKQDVGKRLALWALANVYGKKVVFSGPLAKGHRIQDGRVIVLFDHTGGGLRLKPGADGATGVTIAGADRVFLPARAEVVRMSLVVWHPAVPEPKAVRYAWANAPRATLFNRESLPASPFRTDDWPMVTAGRR